MPRVSVCIPAYNQEAYIGAAINGVLSQSLEDFELILVDDCSTDRTMAIAGSITDSRIQLIENHRHFGMIGNWNRCIELARSPIICILHGDDMYKPDFLQSLVPLLEQDYSLGFAFCAWTWRDDSSGKTIDIQSFPDDKRFEPEVAFPKFLLGNITIPAAVAVRRSVYEHVGMYNNYLRYGPDWEMWLRITAYYPVAYCARCLVEYRTHSRSVTSQLRQHPFTLAREELAVLESIRVLAREKPQPHSGVQVNRLARQHLAGRQFHRAFWFARCGNWHYFRAALLLAFVLNPVMIFGKPFLKAFLRSYKNSREPMHISELEEYGIQATPLGL